MHGTPLAPAGAEMQAAGSRNQGGAHLDGVGEAGVLPACDAQSVNSYLVILAFFCMRAALIDAPCT